MTMGGRKKGKSFKQNAYRERSKPEANSQPKNSFAAALNDKRAAPSNGQATLSLQNVRLTEAQLMAPLELYARSLNTTINTVSPEVSAPQDTAESEASRFFQKPPEHSGSPDLATNFEYDATLGVPTSFELAWFLNGTPRGTPGPLNNEMPRQRTIPARMDSYGSVPGSYPEAGPGSAFSFSSAPGSGDPGDRGCGVVDTGSGSGGGPRPPSVGLGQRPLGMGWDSAAGLGLGRLGPDDRDAAVAAGGLSGVGLGANFRARSGLTPDPASNLPPPLDARSMNTQSYQPEFEDESMENVFDREYPPFDLRAALDLDQEFSVDAGPFAFNTEIDPAALDLPELITGSGPGPFERWGADKMPASERASGVKTPPQTMKFDEEAEVLVSPPPAYVSRFRRSPMGLAMQMVDPVAQVNLGVASRLFKGPNGVSPTMGGLKPSQNLITAGILTHTQVVELFGLFKIHLNHWVQFPSHIDIVTMVNALLKKCSLLVTVCSAVALRLCSRETCAEHYPQLIDFLATELSASLAISPQTFEFVQAIMILSIYAVALSSQKHVFDMWYLSGIGIQHCLMLMPPNGPLNYQQHSVRNHLTHAHMHSSILSGRYSLISTLWIRVSRQVLGISVADSFDSCILAEILMYDLAMQYYRNELTFGEYEAQMARWEKEFAKEIYSSKLSFVEYLRQIVYFGVRVTHLRSVRRLPTPPTSVSSKIEFPVPYPAGYDSLDNDNILTMEWVEGLPTPELLERLRGLGTVVHGIISPVEGKLFRHLSDMLHDTAFAAALLAVSIRNVIASRPEGPSLKNDPALKNVSIYVQRLAELFQASSRGPDTQGGRCYALLKSVQLGNSTHQALLNGYNI